MSEWREVRLGDYIKTNIQSIGKDYQFDKILYLDTGSITENRIEKLQEFNIKEIPSRAKRLVQNEDIIYSSVRPNQLHYGFIKNPEENLIVSTGFVVISCNREDIYPKHLFYYLSSDTSTEYLHSIAEASTSAYPSLKPSDIEALDMELPPLPEQKAIAEVLSSLDDKIDLLHRQKKTLEQMTETLFRQWFVVEAGEDWEEGVVSDLIDFNPKRTLAKKTVATYLEMASLNTQTFHPDSWYDREFKSGTKFINEDTLLARITPCLENGKTAYVTFLQDNQVAWGSTEYIVMRPRQGIHPFFAYVLARNKDFREYAEGCLAGSSGRQRIDLEHLKNFYIPIPPENIIEEFNKVLAGIVPKLIVNANQIRTLQSLRDTLLPKLMSGEVRVKYRNEANF